MTSVTNWKGLPRAFIPERYEGFVYEITNLLNGRKYIGKKYLWHINRIKVRGRKNRKRVKKESDWREYKSSCKELLEDIEEYGEMSFHFKIISFHTSRSEVDYQEAKLQFMNDVLSKTLPNGEYAYYNSNILRRFFRKK